ncbi:MAG: adenylate/guanylate cyclase domain-containing protein [Chloroflexota bacterium]|nr:adenylate/guanylate cyclase domain-containing protein [Chloroflexota bacterium]
MRRLPVVAQIYIWGVMAGGAIALLLLSLGVGIAEPGSIPLALFCALILLVTEAHPIPLSYKITITVSTAVIFAAISLMGPALTCWAIALGMSFAYVYLKREWFKVTFNTAAYILTAASAGLTYQLTNGGETALLVSWRNTLSLCLAAVVYLMLNSWLVAGVVALSEKQDIRHIWTAMLERMALQYLALILLGVLTAVVYGYVWWALVLLVLPLVIVYHSLKASQELRVNVKAEEKLRTALQKYVSPRVLQMIMEGEGMPGLIGEERRATVLFADIRGFTKLVETAEPRTVVRVLNEYFFRMTDIISSYQGIVDEFAGDEILASFDVTFSGENDAKRAVIAAVEMLARLKGLQEEWKRQGLPTFDIGIGISTGTVTRGSIGSRERMALISTGNILNIASRGQELTKKFEMNLIITQSTFEQVKDIIAYQELGPVKLDGVSKPVPLFGVYGLK